MNTPEFFRENQKLSEKTYYGVGGNARYFAEPTNISEVQNALLWSKDHSLPCSILGSGSNSVYADTEFDGVVISLEKLSAWHWETKEILFVEAGVTNTEVAEICLAESRDGAAWMYRMPGQMGATVRMNARCYGGEISQIVMQVMTIDTDGIFKTYSASEVFQGYKNTSLMHKPEIVVAVRLFLPKKMAPVKILKYMQECEADRHAKKHFYMPSCGSTFKNNYAVGKPSGKVFDELGLKGTKRGAAEVSQFHGNFILNTGGAKAADILSLAAFMRQKAKDEARAELELEVQPVGLFSEELYQSCGMTNLGPSYTAKNGERWTGLLWFPVSSQKSADASLALHSAEQVFENLRFPKRIFFAPFIEYSHRSYNGLPHLEVEIVQLKSLEDAQKEPHSPFLEWRTHTTQKFEKDFNIKVTMDPPVKPWGSIHPFVNELWHYSVSEIFLADFSNPENYIEVEITPYGEWVALEFMGTRQRTPRNIVPNRGLWPGLTFINSKVNNNDLQKSFGLCFSYTHIEKLLKSNKKTLKVQCALSLGNQRYFLAPYWKDTATSTPDFHQVQRFWRLDLY